MNVAHHLWNQIVPNKQTKIIMIIMMMIIIIIIMIIIILKCLTKTGI